MSVVDDIRDLLLRELVHAVNLKRDVDAVWFEICDEQSTRSLSELSRRRKRSRNAANPKQITANDYAMKVQLAHSKSLVVTQLTAALLYGRYDIFRDLFDLCRSKERAIVRNSHKHSQFNLAHPTTLWAALERLHILDPLMSLVAANWMSNLTSVLARILTLTSGTPRLAKSLQAVMQRIYFQVKSTRHDFAEVFRMTVARTVALMHGMSEEDANLLLSKPDLCGSILMPHIPAPWVASMQREEVQDLGSMFPNWGDDVIHQFTARIYDDLIMRPDYEQLRWLRSHLPGLLAYMDHRIRPYMTSLLPGRQPPKKPPTPLTEGYAFRVDRKQCTYELTDKYCIVQFKDFQFVIRRSEYEAYQGSHWLYILHGAYTTPQSPEWLRELTVRRHNRDRVVRLRFGLLRSDGIMVPWPEWLEGLEGPEGPEGLEGEDVTRHFALEMRHWVTTRTRERPVPFKEASILDRHQLVRFAPKFALFSHEQRLLFYMVFWNIGSPVLKFEDTATVRNVVSMVEDVFDFHNTTEPVSKRRNITLNKFWDRLYPLEAQFAPCIRALMIMNRQANRAPLEVCMTLISRPFPVPRGTTPHEAMVLKSQTIVETLRLLHLLGAELTPRLSDLRLHTIQHLGALLYAFGVPSEIRRTAWHSLISIPGTTVFSSRHPMQPGSTQPLILPEHMALVPRLRTQFQTIATSDWTRTLTVRRSDGMGTNPALFHFDDEAVLLMSGTPVSAANFDLRFADEEGRGPSVQREVLERIWRMALKEGIVTLDDTDGTLCMASNPDENQHRRVFELGFISGLAVFKGFYLPFPLCQGWWRFLYSLQRVHMNDDEEEKQPDHSIRDFFPERIEKKRAFLATMSSTDKDAFLDSMGIVNREFMDDDDLIEACFLPKVFPMMTFKNGWDTFMRRVQMPELVPFLNDMFTEPAQSRLSAEKFTNVFHARQHPEDDQFLEAVQHLPFEQLERLVHYITGKPRLPLMELCEDKITVSWNNRNSTLPIAQNCINSLLMPVLEQPPTAAKIIESLRPIFEFDTVYGFA